MAHKLEGDTSFVNDTQWSAQRRLVAVLIRCGVDVAPILKADDPQVELDAVYRALLTLDERAPPPRRPRLPQC